MKLQSALEYLSTHIWAILIIAIIFISLYGLGLFNSNSYAPKASPGACTVQRGYDTQPTLAGQCLNDMPEFVEYFQGGAGANVALPDPKLYWGDSNSFTVNLWTDYFNSNVNFQSAAVKGSSVLVFAIFQHGNCCAPYVQAIEYTGIGRVWRLSSSIPPTPNTWQDWTFTWATASTSNTMDIYLNGQLIATGGGGIQKDVGGSFLIGNNGWVSTGVSPMYISNFQFYSTALSANSVQALYQEGIGGSPIDLQDLIGWWPLNGDNKDYSGYVNNGNPSTGTSFIGDWWQSSAYT